MRPKIRFFAKNNKSTCRKINLSVETHYKLQRCYSNALEFNKVVTLSKIVKK